MSSATAKINPVGQVSGALFPIVHAAEKIIPIIAGRIPLNAAVITAESFIRFIKCDMKTITPPGGKKIATVATNAPQKPAIRKPINAALMKMGPGVICPIAIASANSLTVSQ